MPQDDAGTVPPLPQAVQRPGLRLLVVPGVNPAKWLRVWEERLPDVPVTLVLAAAGDAEHRLRAGDADAGLVRLPVDRTGLAAIPLYTETTVVVAPTDHVLTAADELVPADLADEVLLVPDDDVLAWPDRPGEPSGLPAPATTAQAVELVASGVGVLVVPQSLARLHHRRDLTYRPVLDAPTSTVGLAWVADHAPELVEELIGIVRGRTVNSSRGRGATAGAAADATDAARLPPRASRAGGAPTGDGGTGRRGGATGSGGRASGGTASGRKGAAGRGAGGRAAGGKGAGGKGAGGRGTGGGPARGGATGGGTGSGRGKGRRPR